MKLKRRERWRLGACGAALYLTGAGLWGCAGWLRVAGRFGEEHHPSEGVMRVLHVACGFVALMALGYLLRGHILPGLRAKRRCISGACVCCVLGLLALSALALLYGTEDIWETARTVHVWAGLWALLPFGLHALTQKRTPTPTVPMVCRR